MDHKFEVFVQENIEYYSKAWKRDLKWNWAAFFLGYIWLGYRKMYSHMFGFFGLNLLIMFILIMIDYHLLDSIFPLANLGLCFFFGLLGNNLYKMKAERTINRVSQLGLSELDEITEIERRGGKSGYGILAAIGAYFLFLLMVAVITIAVGLLRYDFSY